MYVIVHRDYTSSSEPIIKIFDDHIEFFNPGKLLGGLSIEQLLIGNYTSSIRNKQIASLFKDAGLIERYGSGIKRILESFSLYKLSPPLFEELQEGVRVIVCQTTYKTPHKTPHKTPQKESLRERILVLIKENPSLSQQEISEVLGISFHTVREYFSKLKKEQKIKREGGRKSGQWVICE